ncbi:hypothetical protein HZC09_04550 [Candidatus Micrarchaeota archaeon]|nr:hypothetical protein [Candidatus Micrarchaeota archaeon]
MSKIVSLFLFSVFVIGFAAAAGASVASTASAKYTLTIKFDESLGTATPNMDPTTVLQNPFSFSNKVTIDGKEYGCFSRIQLSSTACFNVKDDKGKLVKLEIVNLESNKPHSVYLATKEWVVRKDKQTKKETKKLEERGYMLGYTNCNQKEFKLDKDTEISLPAGFAGYKCVFDSYESSDGETRKKIEGRSGLDIDKYKVFWVLPSYRLYNFGKPDKDKKITAHVTVEKVVYDEEAYLQLTGNLPEKLHPSPAYKDAVDKKLKEVLMQPILAGYFDQLKKDVSVLEVAPERPEGLSSNTLYYTEEAPHYISSNKLSWDGKTASGKKYVQAQNGEYKIKMAASEGDFNGAAESPALRITTSEGVGQHLLDLNGISASKPLKFRFGGYFLVFTDKTADGSGLVLKVTDSGGQPLPVVDSESSEQTTYPEGFTLVNPLKPSERKLFKADNGNLKFIVSKHGSGKEYVLTIMKKQATAPRNDLVDGHVTVSTSEKKQGGGLFSRDLGKYSFTLKFTLKEAADVVAIMRDSINKPVKTLEQRFGKGSRELTFGLSGDEAKDVVYTFDFKATPVDPYSEFAEFQEKTAKQFRKADLLTHSEVEVFMRGNKPYLKLWLGFVDSGSSRGEITVYQEKDGGLQEYGEAHSLSEVAWNPEKQLWFLDIPVDEKSEETWWYQLEINVRSTKTPASETSRLRALVYKKTLKSEQVLIQDFSVTQGLDNKGGVYFFGGNTRLEATAAFSDYTKLKSTRVTVYRTVSQKGVPTSVLFSDFYLKPDQNMYLFPIEKVPFNREQGQDVDTSYTVVLTVDSKESKQDLVIVKPPTTAAAPQPVQAQPRAAQPTVQLITSASLVPTPDAVTPSLSIQATFTKPPTQMDKVTVWLYRDNNNIPVATFNKNDFKASTGQYYINVDSTIAKYTEKNGLKQDTRYSAIIKAEDGGSTDSTNAFATLKSLGSNQLCSGAIYVNWFNPLESKLAPGLAAHEKFAYNLYMVEGKCMKKGSPAPGLNNFDSSKFLRYAVGGKELPFKPCAVQGELCYGQTTMYVALTQLPDAALTKAVCPVPQTRYSFKVPSQAQNRGAPNAKGFADACNKYSLPVYNPIDLAKGNGVPMADVVHPCYSDVSLIKEVKEIKPETFRCQLSQTAETAITTSPYFSETIPLTAVLAHDPAILLDDVRTLCRRQNDIAPCLQVTAATSNLNFQPAGTGQRVIPPNTRLCEWINTNAPQKIIYYAVSCGFKPDVNGGLNYASRLNYAPTAPKVKKP